MPIHDLSKVIAREHNMRRIGGHIPLTLSSFLLLVALLLSAQAANAQQVPPFGGDIYIQTSGPNTPINIGDYYTSTGGEPNPAERLHRVQIYVPCAWPAGVPVTFAVFDPESSGGLTAENIGAGLPATADEQRGGVDDNTLFRVFSPTSVILSNQTFVPTGGAHQRWVELVTFDPSVTGCGKYIIESTTSDNDDNSWALRVGHDPDCTVTPGTCTGIGAATSALLANNNITSDFNGVPGTGDEIFVGFTRISYQHNATSCQSFYLYIDYTRVSQTIALNNFDMDPNFAPSITITYTQPDGTIVPGTPSENARWNNSPNTTRVGDLFTITPATVGWWEAEVCINPNNQYIFEGIEGEDVFIQPVPEPEMTVAKDDGRTEVSASGQEVTYVINYANIGAGAALNVEIVDTLPAGAVFVSCSGSCTNSGSTVTWALPVVAAGTGGSVSLTVTLPPAPSGSTHTNTVTLSYEDLVGHPFPDVSDDDVDLVVATTPTPTFTPVVSPFTPSGPTPGAPATQTPPNTSINKTVNPPFAKPGETVTWTITVGNPGPQTLTNVRVVDTLPAQFEVLSVSTTLGTGRVSGQTVTVDIPTLAVNANAVITVRARIRASAQPPYLLENNACMTSAQVSAAACAKATVSSAAGLPATGESPWSALRVPILLSVGLVLVTAFALLKRPARRV